MPPPVSWCARFRTTPTSQSDVKKYAKAPTETDSDDFGVFNGLMSALRSASLPILASALVTSFNGDYSRQACTKPETPRSLPFQMLHPNQVHKSVRK